MHSLINNNSTVTYVVCSHDWSFLEGDKRHSRTLKAGRHCFNFQLDVGASLPSSICSTACGGASVTYKLRATATRPGLSHNISHITPVYILRTFTPESLEYQQTLEIENTWPEKLMYAIMLPHKAWAGGDTLSAVLKFSPLAKGVTVDRIVTRLCETTKVFARSGHQEETKVIASAGYDLIDGQVVGQAPRPGSSRNDDENQDIVTCINLPIPRSTLHHATSLTTTSQLPTPPLSHNNSSTHLPSIASISTPSPLTSYPILVTPSHSLDPISVTHRIRWSIFIRNRDGHVSELRCSLPVAILDTRFLSDARAHSGPSRRMLLETSGLAHLTHTLGLDGAQTAAQDADRELPSYTAHVRDRVAYPENAGASVEVMCLSGCSSPVVAVHDGSIISPVASSSTSASVTHNLATAPQSGYGTPSRLHDAHAMPMSQLPPHPGHGANGSLEWVNFELLSSLGSESAGPSSTLPSRAPSPDREASSSPLASTSASSSSSSATESSSSSSTRHHHHHHHRGLGSLIKAFTSLAHHHHHDKERERSTVSPGHSRPSSRGPSSRRTSFELHQQQAAGDSSPSTPVDRAFSEVPDYSTASRGFLLGGVPPLTSMRGLPSYEEVERERRDEEESVM